MDCREVQSQLIRYVDEDLSSGTTIEIEEHLEYCYLCREELEEVRGLLGTCRDALRHPNPRNRFEELRPQLRAPVVPPNVCRYRPKYVTGKLVVAAAVILLLVSFGDSVLETTRHLMMFAAQMEMVVEEPAVTSEPDVESLPLLVGWRQRILWAKRISEDVSLRAGPLYPQSAPETNGAGSGALPAPFSSRPLDEHRRLFAG